MPMADDDCERSYTLADVDEAERRIRAECPGAFVSRGNFDWTLAAMRGDWTRAYYVYDSGRNRPTVIGNIDAIIRLLNAPCCS